MFNREVLGLPAFFDGSSMFNSLWSVKPGSLSAFDSSQQVKV